MCAVQCSVFRQSSVQRGRKGVGQSHCTIHHSIVLSPHCNITLLCRKDPVRCSASLPYPPPHSMAWTQRLLSAVPRRAGTGLAGFSSLARATTTTTAPATTSNAVTCNHNDTIFALSSGAEGVSGVAIIRVSGPSARHCLESITKKSAAFPKPRMATLRHLVSPSTQEVLDHAMVRKHSLSTSQLSVFVPCNYTPLRVSGLSHYDRFCGFRALAAIQGKMCASFMCTAAEL